MGQVLQTGQIQQRSNKAANIIIPGLNMMTYHSLNTFEQ